MMMIRQRPQPQLHQHPTVEIPSWDPPYDDPTAGIFSPQTTAYFSALHRYLPSCEPEEEVDEEPYCDTESCGDVIIPNDSCDNFRMYEFKIRRCARGRSHDWTECPFAHPGEKARRRDPRKYHYSGTSCPDFRSGCCRKGDRCEFSHGVFECWLHPARYRTQPCKDGARCLRRVCFFAHTPDQLRILPNVKLPKSPPSQLGKFGFDSVKQFGISPNSVLERFESPPMSPSYGDSVSELVNSVLEMFESPPMSANYGESVSALANSVRGLQIGNMGLSHSPRSGGGGGGWGGVRGSGYGSPRSPTGFMSGFNGSSLTRTPTRSGLGYFDPWEVLEEESPMERVESGKDVRARIYAKLSMDNSDRVNNSSSPGPDFGWVSELVE